MHKRSNFRARLNKNDGKYFQVDNLTLNLFEVVGHLLIIASLIIYLLHDKLGLKETWLGWLCLVIGLVLVYVGVALRTKNNKS